VTERGDGEDRSLAAYPWRAVALLALGTVAVLLAVARRYGWHRDELYFLEAGRHLAWGYLDQPPLTPFVARVADELAPGNLVVLRTLPALAVAATVAIAAATVRELGGSSRAQAVGGAAAGLAPFVLGVGHLLSTAVFDLAAWMALLLVAARLLRTGDARWWVPFGAVAGLSMLNKNLLVLLGVALGAGLVVERRRDLLLTPWLPAGASLALAVAAPNLLWQADHGWPQADMARVLAERIGTENRVTLLPAQVLFAGPLLVLVVVAGARWLARDPAARRFRPLLWAWPAGVAAALVTGGRPYYVLPLTLTVVLAGVASQSGDANRLHRTTVLVAADTLVGVLLALPVLPLGAVDAAAAVNEAVAETVGWPELVDQVAGVVADLPADERASVVLLTASYGEAGAIDRFGPSRGLPAAHSPHNSYADFRRPADEGATVVAIRFPVSRLAAHFERCEQVATVDNGLGVDNEVQGTPILVCRGLRRSWDVTWEQLRFLS
jgi:4-amino-4-deoxy-L-arabinose transferase-like glycosyltransferase